MASKANHAQSDEDIRLKIGDKVDGRWQIHRKLGQGAFGAVYETLDGVGQVKGPKALKLESINCIDQVLKIEVAVLNAMKTTKHRCKLYAYGRNDKFNFMIMTLLGPSICNLRKNCPNQKFTLPTTLMVTVQCLEALKDMHTVGWLHRDIKPSNFAMGLQDNEAKRTVFMFDFGLARYVLNKDKTLRPPREQVGFRGTLRYCSLNAHKGKELGKHDDLISLLYMMIEMVTGTLPWKQLVVHKDVETGKQKSVDTMYNGELASFKDAHQHLYSLLYEDTPPYYLIEETIHALLPKTKMTETPFDWDSVKPTSARNHEHEKTQRSDEPGQIIMDLNNKGKVFDKETVAIAELPLSHYREIPQKQK